ncbi:hypothetical protein [Roseibium algae]|uniref:Integrase catalytic domain-containing protein n=1 Tax=Roseibium algae TaxID=3123038 RepID=A0ABU8TMJ6_9HYPH
MHVILNDHSRVANVKMLKDQTAFTWAMFLVRAVKWFRARGALIERLMTDNGVGLRPASSRRLSLSSEQGTCARGPISSRTNGKAEGFIKTLQKEWAYAMQHQSSQRPKHETANQQINSKTVNNLIRDNNLT